MREVIAAGAREQELGVRGTPVGSTAWSKEVNGSCQTTTRRRRGCRQSLKTPESALKFRRRRKKTTKSRLSSSVDTELK